MNKFLFTYAKTAEDFAKVVLLTGIGFGGYQIIGDERVPYSELEVIDDYFENGSLDVQQIKEPC